VPEGDTLARTADGLRPHLLGRRVTSARARVPGPAIQRIVGATVTEVVSLGKNLLIRFDNGLEIRTHLRLRGTWHCYRPGEPWRRAPGRASLVLEVPGAVAVAFDVPVVELLEQRAEHLHAPLGGLGPDLLDPNVDLTEARRRLRAPARADRSIAEAITDQRAVAGLGNVYKSELLWLEGIDPFASVADVDDATLDRLLETGRRLMVANAGRAGGPARITTAGPDARRRDPRAGGDSVWVYRRAGRPCRRCGTLIRSAKQGDLPRTTYWCPGCQIAPGHS
jgi:endonuclease VIII